MKTDFSRYGNLTPEEINAALAATGSAYTLPAPIAMVGQPQIAEPAFPTAAPASPAGYVMPVDVGARLQQTSQATTPAPVDAAPPPEQSPPRPRPAPVGAAPRPKPGPVERFVQSTQDAASAAQDAAAAVGGAYYDTVGKQADVDRQRAEQAAKTAEAEASLRARQVEEMDRVGADFQRRRDAIDAERKAAFEAYKSANKEASAVEIKDRRTTGQRVLGALSLIASGIATGYSGAASALAGTQKTNYIAMTQDAINAAVERDLQAQRENARGKRENAAAKRDEWQIAGQFARDEQEREEMARLAIDRKYTLALQAEAAKLKPGEIRSAAEAAALERNAKILEREQQNQDQRAEKWGDRAYQASGALAQRQQAQADAARRGADPMAKLKLEEQELKNAELRRKLGQGGAGGETDIPGYRRTKDVSSTQATQAATMASILAAQKVGYRRLGELRAKNKGGVGWSSADAAEAEKIIDAMADRDSQLAGGGQAGEAAKQATKERLKNPTDYALFSDPEATYRQELEQQIAEVNARMSALGYESAEAEGQSEAAKLMAGGTQR